MADEFNMAELPNSAQDYIRSLRTENARYRTERNDFKDKYADAGEALREAGAKVSEFTKFQEDHEKLVTEKSAIEAKFNRLSVASEFGIASHADRLKGSTMDELKTDAEALAKQFGAKTPGVPKDPAAGKPPVDYAGKANPLAQAFRDAGFNL